MLENDLTSESGPTSVDPAKLPIHIGLIMDGNGRWAQKRKKPRRSGHREGLNAAKRIVKAASDTGIRYLTLYIFSTENWSRTEGEVSFLMFLIRSHLKKELDFYRENNIRVIHSGDTRKLPAGVVQEIRKVVRDTAGYGGLTVNLAINYGGRDEVIRAVKRWVEQPKADPLAINEKTLAACLDHPELPDPDLIIRTGDEKRISNFLLWESAYAEFLFSPKLWPDWDERDLLEAIGDFQRRRRRFGKAG